MAKIINGKEVANKIKSQIENETRKIQTNCNKPILSVVLVGNDPASKIYVNNKKKACLEAGFESREYLLPEQTTETELLTLIEKLNNDGSVNGILVQLPLPKHIDEKLIIEKINPLKDVDAFNTVNVGKIMIGNYHFLPCTPAGIIEILNSENINISGKHCVIVGRSNIVGKPLAMLLLHNDATVTICHSKTQNLKNICREADILIVAVGKSKFINKDYVKENAVIIDVGINRDSNGTLCGDVDFNDVVNVASYITPVPGGVGPMTIAMLMKNTLTAYKLQNKL